MCVCAYVCACYTVKSNDCWQNLEGFDSYLCDYVCLCLCLCKCEGFCVEPGPVLLGLVGL